MPDGTTGPITIESLATIGGASFATFIVSSAIQRAFDYNPKWLALLIALVFSYFAVIRGGTEFGDGFIIATINGCLVYLTSVGANTLLPAPPDSAPLGGNNTKRKFLSRWF